MGEEGGKEGMRVPALKGETGREKKSRRKRGRKGSEGGTERNRTGSGATGSLCLKNLYPGSRKQEEALILDRRKDDTSVASLKMKEEKKLRGFVGL